MFAVPHVMVVWIGGIMEIQILVYN